MIRSWEEIRNHYAKLVEAGNTVIVVEHDMQVAAAGGWIIDMGPGAGDEGGRIAAAGTPAEVSKAPRAGRRGIWQRS